MKLNGLLSVSIEIQGKVQGVWYRASAKAEADRLSLFGFVKNQPDGSVYIEVCGEISGVEKFIIWCFHGPDNAKVTQLRIKKIEPFQEEQFNINK